MADGKKNIVVIGASLGGIEAVGSLLSQLSDDFPAFIFVVIHIAASSRNLLDKVLSARLELKVKFAENGEVPQMGVVYIAPPDRHVILHGNKIILSGGPRENRSRPAIDVLFRSAAVEYGNRVIGVILTGLLDDGTTGMIAIKKCGGTVIAQDPHDAQYAEMPESVINAVEVDYVSKLNELPEILNKLVAQDVGVDVKIPEELKLEVMMSQGLESSDIEMNIIGTPVPAVCPDCGGTLSEIDENGHLRYRCHEGHAYGQGNLVAAQNEKTEYALWSAVRNLEEQSNMLYKLARRNKLPSGISQYEKRAVELEGYAQTIKDFLMHNVRVGVS